MKYKFMYHFSAMFLQVILGEAIDLLSYKWKIVHFFTIFSLECEVDVAYEYARVSEK